MEKVIFDIEVFPNWWCMVYTEPNDFTKLNVISSDTPNYIQILQKLIICRVLIGFNIKHYDLRILRAILSHADPERIYQLSKAIINDDETDIFNNYNFWNRFNFSDLFDDWLKGGLKEFESNIGLSILESSVNFDKVNLTDTDKEDIIKYCKHDVNATIKLYEYRINYINSKEMLSNMFDIPLHVALKSTNAKLCALILKAKQKYRPLENKFKIPEKVDKYIKDNLPIEVINAFDILNDEPKEFYIFENKVSFGIGGIHSVYDENIASKSDDEYVLVNYDVRSYYPNLMMHYNYMSRNVYDMNLYEEIYELRVKYKQQAKQEEKENGKSDKWKILNTKQEALKLILNTTYGAIKNKYNALYDEYQASSLCYLGQLLLASLSNKLYNVANAIIVQTNTDGVLLKIKRDDLELVRSLIEEWNNTTGLFMEEDIIKAFYQRDVNNYIELTYNEKKPYKLKGRWVNQAEYNITNLNAPITHEAILNYYVYNTPIEETIKNCTDIIKFCFTAKSGNSYSKNYYFINNEPIECNKINRVVATTNESCGTIKKFKLENDDYRFDKIADIPEHCRLMNDELFMPDDLDYEWYIVFAKNKIKELKWI